MKWTAPKDGLARLAWFVEQAGDTVSVSRSDAKAFAALLAWCHRVEAMEPAWSLLRRERSEFRRSNATLRQLLRGATVPATREIATLRQLLKGAQAAAAKATRRHKDATARFAKQCAALKKKQLRGGAAVSSVGCAIDAVEG